ncbi:MAG TPA: hypothetical protein DCG75_15460 [Bacteroidales bacterium]|nr:hypothetical protein [Bacteroidales bacterium]
MAKKNFSGGIDSLFQSNNKELTKEPNLAEEKEKIEYARTTLIINKQMYEKIKAVAYWERKQIKDIIEEAFKNILSRFSENELEEILEFYKKDSS